MKKENTDVCFFNVYVYIDSYILFFIDRQTLKIIHNTDRTQRVFLF